MKKLIIATHNKAKYNEICHGIYSFIENNLEKNNLPNFFSEIISLSDINVQTEPEENGKTFEENAILKAKFYANLSNQTVLSDDGGFEIDFLNGEPGVFSKRWLGREASDDELINYTLEKMRNVPIENRKAKLTVCLCVYDFATKKIYTESASIKGYISEKPKANYTKGFPFRAIFMVDKYNKYYEDLTEDEHNNVNHRLLAIKNILLKLSNNDFFLDSNENNFSNILISKEKTKTKTVFEIENIRDNFPIFTNNPNLVYLDSSATSLKPACIIEKECEYYESYSANIHRGIYDLSERATNEYEETRKIVADFIDASSDEIIFTKNTTESLNIIASSFLAQRLKKGDEILTTVSEHHANFVPFQQLAIKKGAKLKIMSVKENGILISVEDDGRTVITGKLDEYLSNKTAFITLTMVSNVLGTINPIKALIQSIRAVCPNVPICLDIAQFVSHRNFSVKDFDCDFIAFSSHKMFGPTGVGVLWGKKRLLEEMEPYQYGGDMISNVSYEDSTFKDVPYRFEAGTPNIAGIITFKEAILFLSNVGMDKIQKHEEELIRYALLRFEEISNHFSIIGTKDPNLRCGLISFVSEKYHPHDIAYILNENNIAVRAGYHCAMPLHKFLKISASTRVSFSLYNKKEDIDKLIENLKKIIKLFD